MIKPDVMVKWDGEESAPISRWAAADAIRRNRRDGKPLGTAVFRRYKETYIVNKMLGVGCCIHRA